MAKKWQPWVSGSKCGPHLVVQESTRFAQIQLVLTRFEPAFVAFAAFAVELQKRQKQVQSGSKQAESMQSGWILEQPSETDILSH